MTGYFDNPYFSADELRCKGSGILQIEPEFLKRLIEFRKAIGIPMLITSGCRSPEYNRKIGGAGSSFHLTENSSYRKHDGSVLHTCAVDFKKTPAVRERNELVKATAWSMGFTVGGGRTFYHIDLRRELAANAKPILLFNYPNGSF